jgi:carotenoid cleavage dioxygenase
VLDPVFPDPELVKDADPAVKNVANTSLVQHGGHILALYEGGLPYELTSDLETRGEFDYHGKLPASMTAHPHIDPVTEEMHFFRYDVVAPFLTRGGTLIRSVPIDLDQPSLMHDFAVTEDHVLFFHTPARLDLEAAMRKESVLQWKPELGTRVGVVDRGTDEAEVTWFDTDPFFVFHFMNAFERDGQIHVDYVHRESFFVGRSAPALHRMSLDLPAGMLTDRRINDEHIEFPRVDERVTGGDYAVGYTIFVDDAADYTLPGPRQPDGILRPRCMRWSPLRLQGPRFGPPFPGCRGGYPCPQRAGPGTRGRRGTHLAR